MKQKRAAVTITEMIMGTIVAVILLITLIRVGNGLYGHKDDYLDSFKEFAQTMEEIGAPTTTPGTAESVLLRIEKDTAIFGFNRVAKYPDGTLANNGRIGDGNFYYRFNNDIIINLFSTSMKRPNACGEDNACLCLCKKPEFDILPNANDYDKTYFDNFTIDQTKDNPYQLPSLTGTLDAFEKKLGEVITCKETICQEIPNVNLYGPLTNDFFYNVTEKGALGHRKEMQYVFENGFAFYREDKEDAYEDYINKAHIGASLGYQRPPASTQPVYLAKLKGGLLAVCIAPNCLAKIEQTHEDDQNFLQAPKQSFIANFEMLADPLKKLLADKENECFMYVNTPSFHDMKGQFRLANTQGGVVLSYELPQTNHKDVGKPQNYLKSETIPGLTIGLVHNDDGSFANNFYDYYLDPANKPPLAGQHVSEYTQLILKQRKIYYEESTGVFKDLDWDTEQGTYGYGDHLLYKKSVNGKIYITFIPTKSGSKNCVVDGGMINTACFNPDYPNSFYELAKQNNYVRWAYSQPNTVQACAP